MIMDIVNYSAAEAHKIAVSPQTAVPLKVWYARGGLVPFRRKGLPPGLAQVSQGSFAVVFEKARQLQT